MLRGESTVSRYTWRIIPTQTQACAERRRTIAGERERRDHSKPHLKLIVKPITINKQDWRGWNLVKQASSSVDLLPVGHFCARVAPAKRHLTPIRDSSNYESSAGGQVRHEHRRLRPTHTRARRAAAINKRFLQKQLLRRGELRPRWM